MLKRKELNLELKVSPPQKIRAGDALHWHQDSTGIVCEVAVTGKTNANAYAMEDLTSEIVYLNVMTGHVFNRKPDDLAEWMK